MKKHFISVLCVLFLIFGCIYAYAYTESYTGAITDKMESIKLSENYMDGHTYFTDVNNDGTDEVILIYYDGIPYNVSLISYAPEYNFSENGICSEQVFYEPYFFSGNVCIGDVSVYKDGDFLIFKDTTFITNGLPNGDPSPTKTAVYKKYKIGAKDEVVFVSQASWSYYSETNQYYAKRGNDSEQGQVLSTKDEVGRIMGEYEKGQYTLLYTVDYENGEGVVYSDVVLTFEQAEEKMKSETGTELSGENEQKPTSEQSGTEEIASKEVDEPAAENKTDDEAMTVYWILIILILIAILVVLALLLIALTNGKNKKNKNSDSKDALYYEQK